MARLGRSMLGFVGATAPIVTPSSPDLTITTLSNIAAAAALFATTNTISTNISLATFISATDSVFAPTISSAATVTASLTTGTRTSFTPTLDASGNVTTTLISATSTKFTPSISTVLSVAATLISVTSTQFSPAFTVTLAITSTSISATSTKFAPTPSSTASVTSPLVTASDTLFAPALSTATVLTTSSISATTNKFTPTLTTLANITSTLISVTSTEFAPTLTTLGNVTTSLVSATSSTFIVSVATGVSITAPYFSVITNLGSFSYRYWKFKVIAAGTDPYWQLSELHMLVGGVRVASTTQFSDTTSPPTEGPTKSDDNDVNTKFLSFGGNGTSLFLDFGSPISPNSYEWYTANDSSGSAGRDPTSWELYGSNDNSTYTLVDSVSGFTPTTTRLVLAGVFPLSTNSPTVSTTANFTISAISISGTEFAPVLTKTANVTNSLVVVSDTLFIPTFSITSSLTASVISGTATIFTSNPSSTASITTTLISDSDTLYAPTVYGSVPTNITAPLIKVGLGKYSDLILISTPFVYLRMEDSSGGTLTDFSGNGRDATFGASNITSVTGKVNSGVYPTSAGRAAIVDAANPGGAPTTVFSLEAWFKTANSGSIICFSNNQTPTSLPTQYDRRLDVNTNGAVIFGIWNGSIQSIVSTGYDYRDNAWHHVVGTFDSVDGMRLYVDGTQVGTNSNTTVFGTFGTWRLFYTEDWGASPTFTTNGQLAVDEAAVYYSLLSAATVSSHFLAGSEGFVTPVTVSGATNVTLSLISDSSIVYIPSVTAGANTNITAPLVISRILTPYQTIILGDSPSGYWRLEETSGTTANDSSGNGRDATYANSPTLAVTGKFDNAVTFDGVDDYVIIPSSAVPAWWTGVDISVEVWFKCSAAGTIFGNQEGGSPTPGISTGWVPAIYIDSSGFIRATLVWHGATSTSISSVNYVDGLWHHIVITYSSGVEKLYVDGSLADTRTSLTQTDYSSGSYNYFLGAGKNSSWPAATSTFFTGQLDEFAIYPSALTSTQVSNHYNFSGLPKPTISTAFFSGITTPRISAYANGSTPPTAITGLTLWLDSADASSFTYSSGSLVSQWNDKSGNNFHAAQATTGSQPQRTGSLNGKSTVVFDGSNDYLVAASFSVSQPATYFVVAKLNNSINYLFDGADTSHRNAFGMRLHYVGELGAFAGNTGLTAPLSTPTPPSIFTVTFNGTSSTIWKDGVVFDTGDVGSDSATAGLVLGARFTLDNNLDGEIAEMITYNSVLSTTDRQAIESYLANKWIPVPSAAVTTGIAIALSNISDSIALFTPGFSSIAGLTAPLITSTATKFVTTQTTTGNITTILVTATGNTFAITLTPPANITTTLVAATSTKFAPTLSGTASITTSLIAATTTLFANAISYTTGLTTSSIAANRTVFAPTLTTPSNITTTLISATSTKFTPSLATLLSLTTTLISGTGTVFTPTETTTASITTTSIADFGTTFTPSVSNANIIISPVVSISATEFGPVLAWSTGLTSVSVAATANKFTPTATATGNITTTSTVGTATTLTTIATTGVLIASTSVSVVSTKFTQTLTTTSNITSSVASINATEFTSSLKSDGNATTTLITATRTSFQPSITNLSNIVSSLISGNFIEFASTLTTTSFLTTGTITAVANQPQALFAASVIFGAPTITMVGTAQAIELFQARFIFADRIIGFALTHDWEIEIFDDSDHVKLAMSSFEKLQPATRRGFGSFVRV